MKPIIKAPTKPLVTKPAVKPKVPTPTPSSSKAPINPAITKPLPQHTIPLKSPIPVKSKNGGKTRNTVKIENTQIVKKPSVIPAIISKRSIRESSSTTKVNINQKPQNTPKLPIRVPRPSKSSKLLKKIIPRKLPVNKVVKPKPANKRIIPQNSRNSEIKENTEIAVKQDVTPEIISKPLISKSSSLVKENKPLKSRNTPKLPIRVSLPSNLRKSLQKITPSKSPTNKVIQNKAVKSNKKIIPNNAVTNIDTVKPTIAIVDNEVTTPTVEILRNYYITLVEHNILPKAVELANIQKLITFLTNIKGPTITDIFSTIREVCPKYLAYITEHKHNIKDQVNNLHDIVTLDSEFMQLSAEEIRGDFLDNKLLEYANKI